MATDEGRTRPPQRIGWIDAARTLACGLVVVVHVDIYYRSGIETWWPGGLLGVPLFTLAVPTFFVISGFVSGSPGRTLHPGASPVLRRLERLVPPFLAWNAILLATGSQGRRLSVARVAFYALTGASQLYFLFALVQLLFLQRFLVRDSPPHRLRWILGGAAFGSLAFYFAADVTLWTRGSRAALYENDLNRLFIPWGIFYGAGVVLARSPDAFEKVRRRRLLLTCVIVAALAAHVAELRAESRWLGYNPLVQFVLSGLPWQLLGSVSALAALRRLWEAPWARPMMERLVAAGPDTFGIYLSHVTAQAALFRLWQAAGHESTHWIEVPVLAVSSWVACRLAIGTMRRVRWPVFGALLFGTTRGRP